MNDVIVIGGGPAGVSAAIYAARAGVKTAIVTTDVTALNTAHKIENYYGFSEPISGKFLFDEGIKQAKALGIDVINDEVVSIGFGTEMNYEVTALSGKLETKSIIIATGSQRNVPNIKGLKEFEGKGVSFCAICDGFFFKGKDLAVLGNGQYALHEAMELVSLAKSVTMLTNGEEMNAELPHGIKLNKETIREFCGDEKIENVEFENGSSIDVSGVFVAVGVAGSGDLARKIGVASENGNLIVNGNMETNIERIYAAGDCTGGMLQIVKAAYEGAKAGSEAAKAVKRLKQH